MALYNLAAHVTMNRARIGWQTSLHQDHATPPEVNNGIISSRASCGQGRTQTEEKTAAPIVWYAHGTWWNENWREKGLVVQGIALYAPEGAGEL